MKCSICKHGDTKLGTTTVTMEKNETVVIVKEVPAEICGNCGEYYLGEEAARLTLEMASNAAKRHAEVEILRYAA